MTAELPHSTQSLIPHYTPDVDKQLLQWAHGQFEKETLLLSKKRRRPSIDLEERPSLSPRPEKSPRKHDGQSSEEAVAEEVESNEEPKLSHRNMLLAYKRIWDNLDFNKPSDKKLEPFIWQKIREYQTILQQ